MWHSSFLKKYGPMIPPAHKAHQTVTFSGCNELPEGCVGVHTLSTQYVKPKVIQVTGRGNLYSPGFEKNESYPDSVQCSYQLQAPAGMHVRLKFNTLDIDITESCQSDSVSIHDFDSQGRGMLQVMLCGKQLPYDYVSKSHAFQVVLKTDDFAARRGFNITYWPQSTTANDGGNGGAYRRSLICSLRKKSKGIKSGEARGAKLGHSYQCAYPVMGKFIV
ncbi:plasma kallikrein [Trichonephila clavipes]|nr:plasma kallikrein [Trichonephila clavipes]